MDLMAEQGTFHPDDRLPTWYATYPPVYVPELHDKYEGTLVEKERQRNYDCLREAKKRRRHDDRLRLLPSSPCMAPAPSRRCTSSSTRSASPRSRPSPAPPQRCQDVPHRGRPVPSRPASAPTGWSSTQTSPPTSTCSNTDNMDVIIKGRLDCRGWHLWRGQQQIQRLSYRLSMAGCKHSF